MKKLKNFLDIENNMKLLIKYLPASLVHSITTRKAKNYEKFKKYFLNLDPETIETLREKYLLYTFHKNAKTIPGYKKFLKKKKVNLKKIKTIKDFQDKIPETNKHNYVFKAKKDITDLCIDGNYKKINMLVKSSGHSGKQCYWARSHKENSFGQTSLSIGLDENFNISSKKTLIINGFVLGSWVTGITFNEFASAHSPVINTGPNKEEILETIKEIGNQFEQIMVTGYPPFIKDLVDYGNSVRFPWKKYKINFGAGGEAFPEAWRDYIAEKSGAKKIRSGFGASDIGILGGLETNDTVFIRRLTEKNKTLKKELFGDLQDTPMLFQYPLNLYIHTNKKKELIFTTILPEAVQPAIKYNLQDIGGTVSYKDMQKILKKHNIERDFTLPLPFLYIAGRADGPVKFQAFMIYPENIEECIYQNKEIANSTTGNFRLKTKLTKKYDAVLQIEFQLKKKLMPSKRLELQYKKLCTQTLKKVNGGYNITQKRVKKKAEPKIILYEHSKYPYKSKIKNVYS